MLFWATITVFGFSIATIWYNSSKKKNERNNRLKSIRKQIEVNEKLKTETSIQKNTVEQKLKEFKNK